ncbi:TonB-dependent receptor [Mucilaginibacter sp. BJC16-A38]|uniref:TonB-dependent receptor n=1 Tax=Mucilaginibacter phenanthrenivorans TaxID=1234842 RepID=UPI0021584256|nr:TonB-dependent receptor [Mucilaginibacter phenanthrenivorans]MCR8561980.1 TonB-dependent receptor [Mucilaginibacter phenanthrenivorans]
MKTLLLSVATLLTILSVKAQQITGIVKDQSGQPLKGAALILKRTKDSTTVKLAVTDASGLYRLQAPAGSYFFSVSHIGYEMKNSVPVSLTDNGITQMPDLVLLKAVKNLKEVAITASRPLIEVHTDKLILNVGSSVTAIGQDGLELLRKAPGVTVDQNGGLMLNGKNGVQIYINGKPSPLSGDDLAAFLHSLQASQIDAIEIIANPSAKFDAAGSAGIINIRLKKNTAFGTNGSVNAAYSIGSHSSYSTGLNLNHREGNTNIYGTYNFNDRKSAAYINTDRVLRDTAFNQRYNQLNHLTAHNLQVGLDQQLNKTSSAGFIAGGSFASYNTDGNSITPITFIPTGQVNKILLAGNNTTRQRNSGSFNANYRYADKNGHTLGIDADYDLFRISNDQLQPNNYYDGSGNTFLYGDTYHILSPTAIDIFSIKADYEQNLWQGKLGFGAKVSSTDSKNDLKQFNVLAAGDVLNNALSDNFEYKEQIQAVYLNYNRDWKHWTMQLGVRAERTSAKGLSMPYSSTPDSVFNRDYTGLFPSGALTWKATDAQQWTLNFSRRLDRPSYSFLNPFVYRIDDYSARAGNTQLQPQYTNSLSLAYLYGQKLNISLNYSHVTGVFAIEADTVGHSRYVLINKNLAEQDITSLTASYPIELKWYSAQANMNSYYSRYQSPGINLSTYALEAFLQQDFDLGKGYRAELTTLYNSPAILQGTFKSKANSDVDAGIQKSLFAGKGSLRVAVTDIFHTQKNQVSSNVSGQQLQTISGGETRLLRVAFNYRFGSNKVKPAKRHQTGTEDESRRTN